MRFNFSKKKKVCKASFIIFSWWHAHYALWYESYCLVTEHGQNKWLWIWHTNTLCGGTYKKRLVHSNQHRATKNPCPALAYCHVFEASIVQSDLVCVIYNSLADDFTQKVLFIWIAHKYPGVQAKCLSKQMKLTQLVVKQ